jgi:hypothetical protein
MKRIPTWAAALPLFLSSLLVACGGGGGSPDATSAQSAQQSAAVGRATGQQPKVSLQGLDFWVGEQGPSGETAYSGPQQQPFVCRTLESNLGQPEVDNQDGIGQPVFQVAGNIHSPIVGYSKTCSVKTRLAYFYFNGQDFRPFDPATQFTTPPADMKVTLVNGVAKPFVIRVEAGTINRFAYAIAMLAPQPEQTATPQALNNTAWNRKLVYYMRGGVGIGHQQGTAMFTGGLWSEEKALVPGLLAQGYAIAASSGNETGVHYNLRLGGETAVMVKEHFVQTYGAPKYTVSLGGSGGAIQQYVYAQNHRGLFDAGIPIQSYPDMVSQTIHVADCNLLEQYFLEETLTNPATPWKVWSRRSLIEGLATSDTEINPLTGTPGSSECIKGWFTAAPGVLNPRFQDPRFFQLASTLYGWDLAKFADVKWTHWNDLANIYGTDAEGYAPIPFDNVGVQYGLAALQNGDIDAAEFLRINACAGSWKEQRDYVQWDTAHDPFDARNMNRSAACRTDPNAPSPRRAGDLQAMRAAYSSGHIFNGKTLDIPMIDLRPYLDPKLDMHNARQSFSVRARLQAKGGQNWKRQVIWFVDSPADLAGRLGEALAVLDKYLADDPHNDAQRARIGFVDQCFGPGGTRIAAGEGVWAGVLDTKPKGACAQAYPIHSSSRMVAGDSFRGDMFKCALKPLNVALADGTYGNAGFTAAQMQWLAKIFPDGVCDYKRPDQGRAPGF